MLNNGAENPQRNENKRFESDTEKLVNKHLSDPNHVITDEELQALRVGMTPPLDTDTEQAIDDGDDRIADHESIKEDEMLPGAQKVTPWDAVE